MTDEQTFAWLRSMAPDAGEITVYDDFQTRKRVVVLDGATDDQVLRVKNAIGLRFCTFDCDVRSSSTPSTVHPA